MLLPVIIEWISRKKPSLQEFYVWMGCMSFMACFPGMPDQEQCWSTAPIKMFNGAQFCLIEFMSKKRYLDITYTIKYTNLKYPTQFQDKFQEVHQLINAFNDHYA